MIFCTLFNWAFLPQGIALYRSLQRACRDEFILYVLCIDHFAANVLIDLNLPHLCIVRLEEIETEALAAARANRSLVEFIWTCTSPLMLHVQSRHGAGSTVIYVDADLCFYSDPSVVFAELGDGNIFIHEHDFAPRYEHLKDRAGRFNVGLLAVRNDEQGRACLERWRDQCLEQCVFDPAAGKCGDQNYLDEWPKLYPGLVASRNIGIGRAPWNIEKHEVRSVQGRLEVDGHPLVFYHYHSLRLMRPRLRIRPVVLATGSYAVDADVFGLLYGPYIRALWRAVRDVERTREARKLPHGYARVLPTLADTYPTLLNRQIAFFMGKHHLPAKHNGTLVSALYGNDVKSE